MVVYIIRKVVIIMKCPICSSELNSENHNRCSRFPICYFTGKQKTLTLTEEPFILFDIETTGIDNNSRITEIAAVKIINNEIVDTFEEMCNPGKDQFGKQIFISARISALTGITNKMVSDKPLESVVVKRFIDWIGDIKVFSGQNIKTFDIPFMKRACKRVNKDCTFEAVYVVDTLLYAKKMKLKERGLVENYKQPTLAAYYGFSYNAHRALDDVKACYKILTCMIDEAKTLGIDIVPEKL